MILAIILWYCMDDHLAVIFHNPELGTIPIWLAVIGALLIDFMFGNFKITYRRSE